MDEFKQRLLEFIEKFGTSVRSFEEECDLTNGTVGSIKANIHTKKGRHQAGIALQSMRIVLFLRRFPSVGDIVCTEADGCKSVDVLTEQVADFADLLKSAVSFFGNRIYAEINRFGALLGRLDPSGPACSFPRPSPASPFVGILLWSAPTRVGILLDIGGCGGIVRVFGGSAPTSLGFGIVCHIVFLWCDKGKHFQKKSENRSR